MSSGDGRDDRLMLRRAVRLGETAAVAQMLADGADPNVPANQPLLLLAVDCGHGNVAEVLVAHGADPLATRGTDGWTAATIADAAGDDGLAERLVRLGVPAATRRLHGYTPLHRAARSGDVGGLLNITPGAVDVVDGAGETALGLAIRHRHQACAEVLLAAGANPNHTTRGWSLLADAAYTDSLQQPASGFVGLLLDAGADPRPGGYPPVLATINQEGSSAAVLRSLVRSGADPLAVDGNGENVLHRIASIEDDPNLIDVALELGVPLEARGHTGRTSLLSAAWCANEVTFERLVDRGAAVDARDNLGRSAQDLAGPPPRIDRAPTGARSPFSSGMTPR
ncbi:MAG TPA: hypothetical protein VNS19_04685 [Acidimicrobiales bacterium]|nr:hypothetical protein [Acidimicrobiales bacterium]